MKSKILNTQLCNALQTNSFRQTQLVGQLDLTTNPNPAITPVTYNPSGVGGDIIPGTGLILTDLGVADSIGDPIVDVRAADADAIYGVLVFDTKGGTKEIGDRITVAKVGSIIVMNSNAAILRGAKVALVLATPGDVVTQGAEALFGIALDKASAADDLIRIEVKAQGYV